MCVSVCGSGGDGNTNIHSQSPCFFHGDDVELGRAGCHGYRGHSSNHWNDCAMCKGVNGSLLNTSAATVICADFRIGNITFKMSFWLGDNTIKGLHLVNSDLDRSSSGLRAR